MKKNLILRGVFYILLISIFSSCKDDDLPVYEKKEIVNSELLKVLKTKGFSLEGNFLVMNDKIAQTKKLDISGSNLTTISGLELFPNLEEINLANNKLGYQFDFTKLPKTIKRIDLSDNKIYDYKGLIEVDFETSKMKVLRKLEKIALPASARFNMEALPYYSQKSKETKLTMQNAKTGKAETYNTLREIPDPELRKYLKEKFSSIMNSEGKLDVGKKINTKEETTDVVFWSLGEIKDLEGIEYVVNNPFSKLTTLYINAGAEKSFTLDYIKPRESLQLFSLGNISTPVVDWSNTKHLRGVIMLNNGGLREVDVSYSKYFMQREGGLLQTLKPDIILLYNCKKLEKIKLPDTKPKPILSLGLFRLPMLKSFDGISRITGLARMNFAELPKLKDLNLSSIVHTVDTDGGVLDNKGTQISFSITEDVMSIKGVKEFIMRFGKKDKLTAWNSIETLFYELGRPFNGKAYDYTKLYTVSTKSNKSNTNKIEKRLISFEEFMREIIGEQNEKE